MPGIPIVRYDDFLMIIGRCEEEKYALFVENEKLKDLVRGKDELISKYESMMEQRNQEIAKLREELNNGKLVQSNAEQSIYGLHDESEGPRRRRDNITGSSGN